MLFCYTYDCALGALTGTNVVYDLDSFQCCGKFQGLTRSLGSSPVSDLVRLWPCVVAEFEQLGFGGLDPIDSEIISRGSRCAGVGALWGYSDRLHGALGCYS